MYITDKQRLAAFVERAMSQPVLAIDTEFLREKTYYAKLCLLQLATPEEHAIVDPLKIDDLSCLAPIMENPNVVKLLHSGRQDLEILYRELGVMPWPLFDTQIAAALLGHTQQIGYAALVQSETGIQLKKADSFTDWSRRPLSDSQLRYAADDVIYLPRIYNRMVKRLEKMGRTKWLEKDFRALVDPELYANDPRTRFLKLKRCSTLSRRQLSAARELAAWREERAQHLDIPRKWVMADEQIVEACRREAVTVDSLLMVRGLREKLSMKEARHLVELLKAGLNAPEDTWPELSRKTKNEANVDEVLDVMAALLRLRAHQNDIAPQTLGNHDDLTNIARGHYERSQLMSGWRKEIVGNELVDLLDGKINLSVKNGRLIVEPRD